MLAIVASSSTISVFVAVALLGMREGYPMDTGSWREGVFGRDLGFDGGRRLLQSSSEGGERALSDGVLVDHLLITVCFFEDVIAQVLFVDSPVKSSVLVGLPSPIPLTSRMLLPRIAKNFSAAATF
jgi:hypothetical protein